MKLRFFSLLPLLVLLQLSATAQTPALTLAEVIAQAYQSLRHRPASRD